MFKAYQNIWLCGLAASGKTTLLRFLSNKLKGVEYLNDSLEMVEFIRKDKKEKHHKKPTPNSFILSDSEPVYYSIQQLIKKINKTKNKKIIELSRGKDKEGMVDFSYHYLFSALNKDLKKSSLFIYVYSPFEERLKRNQQRPALNNNTTSFESFHCPQEAMNRFFMEDDFFQAIKKHLVDVLFIPNLYSLKYLQHKVEMLFFNDLIY